MAQEFEGWTAGRRGDHFQQAIALDPAYAHAYSGLAETYADLGGYALMPIADSYQLARDAALKACESSKTPLPRPIDRSRWSLASYYRDWAEAERHLQRAIQLAPE